MAESESDIRITADTAYIALKDELWGVCDEDMGENWRHRTVYVAALMPEVATTNKALGRPAFQSSLYFPTRVASEAVNGRHG